MLKGKKEFDLFRKEMEEALAEVAKKHGFDVKVDKIKYTDTNMDVVVKFNDQEVQGTSFEQAEWNKICMLYNLTPADYGKTFVSNGRHFKIYGFNLRAKTMPVLARDENGTPYKFSKSVIEKLK